MGWRAGSVCGTREQKSGAHETSLSSFPASAPAPPSLSMSSSNNGQICPGVGSPALAAAHTRVTHSYVRSKLMRLGWSLLMFSPMTVLTRTTLRGLAAGARDSTPRPVAEHRSRTTSCSHSCVKPSSVHSPSLLSSDEECSELMLSSTCLFTVRRVGGASTSSRPRETGRAPSISEYFASPL